jgi:endoglucanase
VAGLAAATLIAASVWFATGSASAGTLSGTLYRDPNGGVMSWVAANPNDPRMPGIRDKIASQPSFKWMANFNISTVRAEVSAYVNAANAVNQVPQLSVYEITNRDCGGASAGGAPDLNQYQQWMQQFAPALGNRLVIIVLETDSLALQTCLSSSELAARNQAISTAVQTIKAANPNAKVYLDGGHSTWNSAADQANRLRAAGVQFADGFYTNVSNYNSTANEMNYGNAIISALNSAGVTGKRQLIDTSRNGGASGDWCGDDNTDRRIGQWPTLNTGSANVDGLLWVKPPGEADGCAFTAGSFQPTLANSLIQGVGNPPGTSTTTTSRPPTSTTTSRPPTSTTTSRPPTTTTTTSRPPSGGACSASYQVTNSWPGGYQVTLTITAGSSAINGWTLTWTQPSGNTITQLWSGTLTTSGSTATVRSLSWNSSLGAGASTQIGFLGTGSTTVPAVTCTSP